MVEPCKPTNDEHSRRAVSPDVNTNKNLNAFPWEAVYGKDIGWCEADNRKQLDKRANHRCGCAPENLDGPMCMGVKEAFCPAQCGGRGDCDLGFCRCHSGWYGTDCSRMTTLDVNGTKDDGASSFAGQEAHTSLEAPSLFELRPWLQPFANNLDIPIHRQRPFIYVYDLPPLYNSRMLQYKINPSACSHRVFGSNNRSGFRNNNYAIETYLHEAMLTSSHR